MRYFKSVVGALRYLKSQAGYPDSPISTDIADFKNKSAALKFIKNQRNMWQDDLKGYEIRLIQYKNKYIARLRYSKSKNNYA